MDAENWCHMCNCYVIQAQPIQREGGDSSNQPSAQIRQNSVKSKKGKKSKCSIATSSKHQLQTPLQKSFEFNWNLTSCTILTHIIIILFADFFSEFLKNK